MASVSKLVKNSAKREELEKQTTPNNVLRSPLIRMPRFFEDIKFPPFKQNTPRNPKKSDTMRITPALLEASARLARVMMEPDPEFLQLRDSKRQRKQKKDTKIVEDKAPFKGPFLQPCDDEVTEPHVNTHDSAQNDLGRIEQVFWGEAIALRLPGRVDADGNEDHQEISRHLMIPTKTNDSAAISNSSPVMPPPPRCEILMGSAAATAFKPITKEDEPLKTPPPSVHAELVSSPMTRHAEPMRLPLAPHKALPAPPASHERSMGRRLLATLSSRPNPKHIIYTHASQSLFLPPDSVAAATTSIPPAKKRRSHPTEDGFHKIISDEEGKMQPLKKKRSVKLVIDSMGVSQDIENKTCQDLLLGQLLLPKLSSYVSAWDQVPKSSTKKVVSALSPYVSTWDQVPKSVSENDVTQEPFSGQISLPVESKPRDFFAKDIDADTAAAAGGSDPHVLAGGNVPTSAESSASFTKEGSDPSESELEIADSNAEETCLASLQIRN